MKRSETTNTFQEGLVMDLNPLTTPNSVMTNCLNGTLITYNGNENVLLNDMGNGRVETAKLPKGYIPLGTAELGGIIYIASYNPLTGKSLIGSFPSPERNITSDEEGKENSSLSCSNFYKKDANDVATDAVITDVIKLELTDDLLRTGDKFCIYSNDIKEKGEPILSSYGSDNNDINSLPRWLKLHIVSIQDDGRVVYLDDNLTWYADDTYGPYYIKQVDNNNNSLSIDEYRDVVESNYTVFSSKIPGKLGIVALLEAVKNFSVSVNISTDKVETNDEKLITNAIIKLSFNTNWTYDNSNEDERYKINPSCIFCKINNEDYGNIYFVDETEDIQNKRKEDSNLDILTKEITIELSTNKSGIKTIKTSENKSFEIEDSNILFKLYPYMEYGYLEYLEALIDINIDKLGTGATDLIEYKYYVEDEILTLNYGFDSYPEENKSVNFVKFDFFDINDVKDKIKDEINSKEVENVFLQSFKYTESNEIGEKLILYSFTNTSNSMLGYFSQKINFDDSGEYGLKKNKCYIVRITINYDDTDRYYYRVLYTSKVFNDAFYEEDDFCNLKLSDYLNISFNSNSINTIKLHELTYDDNLNKIDKIPTSKETILKNSRYNINNKYETDTSITSSAYSNYDMFKVNITSIEDVTISQLSENTAKKTYINSDDSDFDNIIINSEYSNINSTINDGICNITFKNNYNVITPISIDYTKDDYLSVLYELSTIEGEVLYLNIRGEDKKLMLGLDDSRTEVEDCQYILEGTDNEKTTYNSFIYTPKIGQGITSLLKNNDWIAIVVNFYSTEKKSNNAYLIMEDGTNNYDLSFGGGWIKKNSTEFTISPGSTNFAYVLFALKNATEYNVFTTLSAINNKYSSDVYGITKSLNQKDDRGIVESTTYKYPELSSIAITDNDNNDYGKTLLDNITNKFSNIYKLIDYTGNGKPVKVCDNIVYWNNFVVNIINNIKLNNIKFNIFIDDINISEYSIVNNFNVDSEDKQFEIKNIIQTKINLDDIISSILNPSLILTDYVYYNNEFLQNSNLNKRLLYSIEDNKVIESDKIFNNKISIYNDGNDIRISPNDIDKFYLNSKTVGSLITLKFRDTWDLSIRWENQYYRIRNVIVIDE